MRKGGGANTGRSGLEKDHYLEKINRGQEGGEREKNKTKQKNL